MNVQLNFINRSNDANNSQIVIFQKNEATSFDELAVAWQVFPSGGHGDHHRFTYTSDYTVAVRDTWGNDTPQLRADPGQLFTATQTAEGNQLVQAGAATSAKEVQVLNNLQNGAVNASIYKDGKLLAAKTGIAPQQKAAFEFKPTIWVGVVSQVVQGQVMDSAILSNVNTELSLLGIASADIVMTGGGPGPSAQPFAFTLQNVVMA